jgi:hypothetical protein
MRTFWIAVLGLAGIVALAGTTALADKFEAHLTRDQVKTNCVNSGGYYDDHTASGGYSCTLPNEKFDCTAAGVCTIGNSKNHGAVSIQAPPATVKTGAKISAGAAASTLVFTHSAITTSSGTIAGSNTLGATNTFGASNTVGVSNTIGASIKSSAGKALNGRPASRRP